MLSLRTQTAIVAALASLFGLGTYVVIVVSTYLLSPVGGCGSLGCVPALNWTKLVATISLPVPFGAALAGLAALLAYRARPRGARAALVGAALMFAVAFAVIASIGYLPATALGVVALVLDLLALRLSFRKDS